MNHSEPAARRRGLRHILAAVSAFLVVLGVGLVLASYLWHLQEKLELAEKDCRQLSDRAAEHKAATAQLREDLLAIPPAARADSEKTSSVSSSGKAGESAGPREDAVDQYSAKEDVTAPCSSPEETLRLLLDLVESEKYEQVAEFLSEGFMWEMLMTSDASDIATKLKRLKQENPEVFPFLRPAAVRRIQEGQGWVLLGVLNPLTSAEEELCFIEKNGKYIVGLRNEIPAHTMMVANEAKARMGLSLIAGVEFAFARVDPDGDGIDFESDLGKLEEVRSALAAEMGMVPQALLSAGSASMGWNGYCFSAILFDSNGKPIDNRAEFAFCAVPIEYGVTGKKTFVVNQNGIFSKDRSGALKLETWPDVEKEDWDHE